MLCVHDALNSWSRSSSCRRKRQLDSSSFLSSFLPLYTWRTGHAPPARIFALSCWATGLSASNRKTILSSPLFLFFILFFFYIPLVVVVLHPPYERQTELLCSLLLHAHVGAETVTESPLVSPLGGWRAVRTTLFYNEGDKVDARGISSTFLNIKRALIIFYICTIDPDAQGSWWSWCGRIYFLTSSASITHRRVDDFPLENSPFNHLLELWTILRDLSLVACGRAWLFC